MTNTPNTNDATEANAADAPEGIASLMIPTDDTEEAPETGRVVDRIELWGGSILESLA